MGPTVYGEIVELKRLPESPVALRLQLANALLGLHNSTLVPPLQRSNVNLIALHYTYTYTYTYTYMIKRYETYDWAHQLLLISPIGTSPPNPS